MSTFPKMKALLEKTPYLVADGTRGKVILVSESKCSSIMSKTNLFSSQIILNAKGALYDFAGLIGDTEREFSLKEVKQIADCPQSQVYHWIMSDVLKPSIQGRVGAGKGRTITFSWSDAFVAGILGSLRRNGCRLEMLAKVQPLFNIKTKTKTLKKKRTTRKLVASGRS